MKKSGIVQTVEVNRFSTLLYGNEFTEEEFNKATD